jgi:hypothetical protein
MRMIGGIEASVFLGGLYYTKRRVGSCSCVVGPSFCELKIYRELLHLLLFTSYSMASTRFAKPCIRR